MSSIKLSLLLTMTIILRVAAEDPPPPDLAPRPGVLTPITGENGEALEVVGPCLEFDMPMPDEDKCPKTFKCKNIGGRNQCVREQQTIIGPCVNDLCPPEHKCEEQHDGRKMCVNAPGKGKDPLGKTRTAASSETPMPPKEGGKNEKRILGPDGKPDKIAELAASLGIDMDARPKEKNALGKTRKAASSETPVSKDPVPTGAALHQCALNCANAGTMNYTYCRDDDDCRKKGAKTVDPTRVEPDAKKLPLICVRGICCSQTPALTKAAEEVSGKGAGEPWRKKLTYDEELCREDGSGPDECNHQITPSLLDKSLFPIQMVTTCTGKSRLQLGAHTWGKT